MKDLTIKDINNNWDIYLEKELFLDMSTYKSDFLFIFDCYFEENGLEPTPELVEELITIMEKQPNTKTGNLLWDCFKEFEQEIKELVLNLKNSQNLEQHLATYY